MSRAKVPPNLALDSKNATLDIVQNRCIVKGKAQEVHFPIRFLCVSDFPGARLSWGLGHLGLRESAFYKEVGEEKEKKRERERGTGKCNLAKDGIMKKRIRTQTTCGTKLEEKDYGPWRNENFSGASTTELTFPSFCQKNNKI